MNQKLGKKTQNYKQRQQQKKRKLSQCVQSPPAAFSKTKLHYLHS